MTTPIVTLGAGAFGTALAAVQAENGHSSTLIGRNPVKMEEISKSLKNRDYLDNISLPKSLICTSDAAFLAKSEVILLSVPAQSTAAALNEVKKHIPNEATIVICAKGIDNQSGTLLSQEVKKHCPDNPIGVLSGPSFAHDIASGKPTALTIAATTLREAEHLAEVLSSPTIRLYASDDIIGVQLGGALKNVLAIAVGIVRGRKLGASAEAALTTRGFSELRQLSLAMGAQRETLTGLSGLGDLLLTCASPQSRNFSYGMAIGSGASLEGMKLAEGVHTAAMAAELARKHTIETPLIETVSDVLSGKIEVEAAINNLLARPLRAE